ncbi:CrcB-like protein [Mycolicibacterium gilvum]|uniref:CrcB-like protein n=1 Tax=Mycolicibacterium gilvum TaxID=1804 RepID=A0A378SI41_9MYCO|nr:CrcB-like protein [Mycolicibacterium gilvum]
MGGTAGALVRYAVTATWPTPREMLVSTVVTVFVAFVVAAYVLAHGPKSPLQFAVLGLCGSVASLSAWAVLTISTTMKISLAVLTLTPTAAVAGLVCGLLCARVAAR